MITKAQQKLIAEAANRHMGILPTFGVLQKNIDALADECMIHKTLVESAAMISSLYEQRDSFIESAMASLREGGYAEAYRWLSKAVENDRRIGARQWTLTVKGWEAAK